MICIDEATQLKEEWLRQFAACLRGVNEFPKRMYYTCYPGGPGHGYIKLLFIVARTMKRMGRRAYLPAINGYAAEVARGITAVRAAAAGAEVGQQEVQLRKLICQQLAGITLPDVAAYFHISVPYASDLIRKITGSNFTALVLEERMRESEKLLKNSNVPVSKVALLSGYQEPSYFMKVFKKYFGCTPSQYRDSQK